MEKATQRRRQRYTHVIGFDDSPFDRNSRGDVLVVGAAYAGLRLVGVLSGKVRRDGANATKVLVEVVRRSRFAPQTQVILLQGIAFAGFNVIDLRGLYDTLTIPVVAVSRRRPDLEAIRCALLAHVGGGARKWRLIEKAGPMEAVAGLYVQRAGISLADTGDMLERLAVNSTMPEPLRTAHMVAGGIVLGESTHRV